jgi:hypothetical protein
MLAFGLRAHEIGRAAARQLAGNLRKGCVPEKLEKISRVCTGEGREGRKPCDCRGELECEQEGKSTYGAWIM